MSSKNILIASCACFSIVMLVVIIIIGVSINNVSATEYGIVYNVRLNEFTDDILEVGRYTLRPMDKVIRYDKTFTSVDMTGKNAIECTSNDGLPLVIDLVSQYKVERDWLHDIIMIYGLPPKIDNFVKQVIQSSIKNVCSHYEVETGFILNRDDVSRAMKEEFIYQLNISDAYVRSEFLEMRNVEYPARFDQSIRDKEAALQNIDRVLIQREETLINARTKLLQAEQEADIILINKNAEAISILNVAKQESEAVLERWNQIAEGFEHVKTGLGYNASDFVNIYISSLVLENNDAPVVINQ